MPTNDEIEQQIKDKGLTAPRLTPDHIRSTIADVKYLQPTSTLTICILTLRNGFTVTGESAAASPENFNQVIGEKIAYINAEAKIWALEGYLLRSILAGHVVEPEKSAFELGRDAPIGSKLYD